MGQLKASVEVTEAAKGANNNVDRNKTPAQLKKLYERNIKAAEDQADAINKKAGKKVLYLVPSAQALVTLRTKIANKEVPGLTSQGELFRDPISHPAPPLEALNTYLHYAVIYGQSSVGLPVPDVLKKPRRTPGTLSSTARCKRSRGRRLPTIPSAASRRRRTSNAVDRYVERGR